MDTSTLVLFAATVLPLICTPGPDMLFVSSQALGGGATAGLRATLGVCLGYAVHSGLVAAGVAALLAAFPLVFAALRWIGVVYLVRLAVGMIRSALRREAGRATAPLVAAPLRRGFLTALLNPKGMMIYFALLPQFLRAGDDLAGTAAALSGIFIALCAAVYSILSLALSAVRERGERARERGDDRRRRIVEGVSGGLLIAAAGRLATNG